MDKRQEIFVPHLPESGKIFIFTGPNGSGKTRMLEALAHNIIYGKQINLDMNRRLICLSGTVLDKFPIQKENHNTYLYLGRKTNNNMFSEIAPYRNLFYFLNPQDNMWDTRAGAAFDALSKIGLGETIVFKFRRGRNTKKRVEEDDLELTIFLKSDNNINKFKYEKRLDELRNGLIDISGVAIQKNSSIYDIADLSSGERSYALTLLSLAFGINNGAFVLYDEPENSLHPKWQESIVRDMWEVASLVASEFKLIIATHSPLIVSGALNKETFTYDLDKGESWVHSSLYGNSSDSVLKEQFGLVSARSMYFINILQECIHAFIHIESQPEKFREAADKLLSLDVNLGIDDPLHATLKEIQISREALQ